MTETLSAGPGSEGAYERVWREPHLVLAVSAAVVVLCELAAQESGSSAPMVVAAGVAFGAFAHAWREQDRLRLLPLLAVTLGFQLALLAVHRVVGLESFDSEILYARWGNDLLDGRYPEAQYPPVAVLLFAAEAWLGDGVTRTANALVMIPFHLATVVVVWAFRTRTAPWLAALVALWPMNVFFWEFRFDLVPTALLALGLLLARRERWALSGVALGTGAAAKWFPGLAFAALAVWLIASRRTRDAVAHVAAFTCVFIGLHLPFLLWSPSETTYAYRYFADQGLTGESIWYVLLNPLGLATVNEREFWLPADVPGWGDPLAAVVQAAALLALVVVLLRVRGHLEAAVTIAAVTPVVFLLLNRVFSPQYLVTILAAWAIAGAVILVSRRDQFVLGVAAMAATAANAFVYPYSLFSLDLWKLASALLFAIGLATTAWIVLRAARSASPSGAPGGAANRPGYG
jgi:hypothetical protein